MMAQWYELKERLLWNNLVGFVEECNVALGRSAVLEAYPDLSPHGDLIVGDSITSEDLDMIRSINRRFPVLDSWESSKLRNLTLDQLNNEITTRQNEINACTTLAQAKTALLNLLADDAKAWRIILWLLKREMNELG